MSYALLLLTIDHRGVAAVTLNRPEVHNAFDDRLIAELTAVFKQLDADDTVRLAVLSGSGKSFCAGGDLNWMRSMKHYGRAENIADSERLEAMFACVRAFSRPLIGVAHGAALGGGSGLAAVCDYVLAADDVRFGFTEARIGIAPSVIAPYVIEKIGFSHARAYFLSGMPFAAPIARDMGLAHRVVPREQLEAAREEVIREFLQASPHAARRAKALMNQMAALSGGGGEAREAIRRLTIETIADLRVSPEGQEGMAALLEKRKAAWVKT